MGGLSNPDYGLDAIMTGINEAKKSVSGGKAKVAAAIAAKGIPTAADSTFDILAANTGKIVTLPDGTADATAGAGQILKGYTAYARGSKVTGSVPSLGAQTITPGTSNKTIAAGQYLSGQQTIKGGANLIAANIVKGKSIFGVNGSFESNGVFVKEINTNSDGTIDRTAINLSFTPDIALLLLLGRKATGESVTTVFPPMSVALSGCFFGHSIWQVNSSYIIPVSTYDCRGYLSVAPIISGSKVTFTQKPSNSYEYGQTFIWASNIPSNITRSSMAKLFLVCFKMS